jgi:aryl-alcohol dehydrogenase-like predicted oxidoreductase
MTDISAARDATFTLGDLPVRRLGFGAMRITGPGIWGEPPDRDEAIAVLRRAVELGVNLIDTADSYGPAVSEQLIAEALHPYPDGVVIATKGGLVRDGPHQWRPDGRPEHLRTVCDGSLARLRLEQIPLYQFHRPDPRVPFEDSVGTLVELQREGKIRHIGLSNVTVAELDRALALTPVASVQNRYSPVDQRSDDVLARCEAASIGFLPWAPLEGGGIGDGGQLERVAGAHGATPHQIAIAWLLARSPAMLPIPGTGSVAHLEENMAAATIELSPDELGRLSPN